DRRGVRVRPEGEERELFRLPRRDLREAAPAMARVDDEEPREPVEVLLAVRIPDVVALAPHDDRRAVLFEHRLAREVHPQMVFGLLLQLGLALRAQRACGHGHDAITWFPSCRAASAASDRRRS